MLPSVRLCAEHVHKPLIRFLGKRSWPSTPSPQRPHPAAPQQSKDAFPDFLKKFESSASREYAASPSSSTGTASGSNGKKVYAEFWEAPERVWRPRSSFLDEAEMEAISTGGASLR